MQSVDAVPAVLYLFMPLFNVILFIIICSHRQSILASGIKASRFLIVSFAILSTGLLAAIIGAFGLTAIFVKAHPRWLDVIQLIVLSLLKFERKSFPFALFRPCAECSQVGLLLVFIINNHLPDLLYTRRFWRLCCLLYILVISSGKSFIYNRVIYPSNYLLV
jgi:hypothetical protein